MQDINATNNIIANETILNVTELSIPRMVSIQTAADASGFAYKTIWKLCKENRIVYIRVGNKYLINFDKFIEYLNTGDHENYEHRKTISAGPLYSRSCNA